MSHLKNLYIKIISRIFRKTIAIHRASSVVYAVEFLTNELKKEIIKKDWTCNEDIIATEYIEILEKKLQLLLDVSYEIL